MTPCAGSRTLSGMPRPEWLDNLIAKQTRPGLKNRAKSFGKDIVLPTEGVPGRRKAPPVNVREQLKKAGKGFGQLRDLVGKSRSPSKR